MSNDYWQVELGRDGEFTISYQDGLVAGEIVVFPNNDAYKVYIDDETGAEKAIPVNLADALRDLAKQIEED